MTLDRFRAATLAEAQEASDAAVAAAREAAEQRRRACEAEAARLVEAASADGHEAASRELAGAERLARRHARELVLRARRALYDRARDAAIAELRGRRGSDDYRELLNALERRAAAQLGAEVRCAEAPEDAGGIVGEAEGRRVVYSLAALVDDELSRRQADIERLWT